MSKALIETLLAAPYVARFGVRLEQKGDELTGILPYSEILVGNPLIPALHGGAIGAFLEIVASASLLAGQSQRPPRRQCPRRGLAGPKRRARRHPARPFPDHAEPQRAGGLKPAIRPAFCLLDDRLDTYWTTGFRLLRQGPARGHGGRASLMKSVAGWRPDCRRPRFDEGLLMFRHTILAATLALSAGSIAAAQDRESRTVRFNTAALGNADDRRELEAEIRLAARDICHTPGLRGARAMRQQRECETEAVNAAMRRVDIRLARLRDERPNPAADVG